MCQCPEFSWRPRIGWPQCPKDLRPHLTGAQDLLGQGLLPWGQVQSGLGVHIQTRPGAGIRVTADTVPVSGISLYFQDGVQSTGGAGLQVMLGSGLSWDLV